MNAKINDALQIIIDDTQRLNTELPVMTELTMTGREAAEALLERLMPKDRYGYQLPVPRWTPSPTEPGYYYYAENRDDWDIAIMALVQTITDSDGFRVEARIRGSWYNVRELPAGSMFCGPYRQSLPPWEGGTA